MIVFLLFGLTVCAAKTPPDPELERRRGILRTAGASVKRSSIASPSTGSQTLSRTPASRALISAAGSGDIGRLRSLLKKLSAARVNGRGAGGETALTHAVWFGFPRAVELLLRAGAHPNLLTDGGETALHYAIHRDETRAAALLLDAGADRRLADRNGYTPLMVAAGLGRFAVTERLLQLGVPATTRDKTKLKRTALLHGIRGGHGAVARLLIRRDTIEQSDASRETALFYAVRKQDSKTLDALLRKGARVDSRNRYGETPLMAAAFFGRGGIARRLLAAGANPGLRDEHGVYDAALIARIGGYPDIVHLLQAPWWKRVLW